jgi:hypothetical protein
MRPHVFRFLLARAWPALEGKQHHVHFEYPARSRDFQEIDIISRRMVLEDAGFEFSNDDQVLAQMVAGSYVRWSIGIDAEGRFYARKEWKESGGDSWHEFDSLYNAPPKGATFGDFYDFMDKAIAQAPDLFSGWHLSVGEFGEDQYYGT